MGIAILECYVKSGIRIRIVGNVMVKVPYIYVDQDLQRQGLPVNLNEVAEMVCPDRKAS